MSIYIHTLLYACVGACIHIHEYAHIITFTYTYIHLHMCVYIYIRIPIILQVLCGVAFITQYVINVSCSLHLHSAETVSIIYKPLHITAHTHIYIYIYT